MVSEHASPLAALGGEDAGGQNVHVAALSRALADAGHEVCVYTRREDRQTPETVYVDGYTVRQVTAGPLEVLPKDALLRHMPQFADVLAERWSQPDGRPDVAHAHFWMSGIATRAAATPLRVPWLLTYHALGSVKRRHQGPWDTSPAGRVVYERAIGQDAHRIIATSTDEVEELVLMGLRRTCAATVPCGVDLQHFTPNGLMAPRSARPRLLSVSRLVPRKGVDVIVRALRGVREAELLVAGGPPAGELAQDAEVRRLSALATKLGVRDRVRFLGRVPHHRLPAVYRSADVVVCTPYYEPFGIVPLEAMACGRPVVATAVGGLKDTVVDGVTGRHVAPDDPQGLALVLRRLLADPFTSDAWGLAGADRAASAFGWPSVASRTAQVYEHVLHQAAQLEAVG